MKILRYSNRPVKASEMSFQDLYEEISGNWHQKAERLQARRRRALKCGVRELAYPNNKLPH